MKISLERLSEIAAEEFASEDEVRRRLREKLREKEK